MKRYGVCHDLVGSGFALPVAPWRCMSSGGAPLGPSRTWAVDIRAIMIAERRTETPGGDVLPIRLRDMLVDRSLIDVLVLADKLNHHKCSSN